MIRFEILVGSSGDMMATQTAAERAANRRELRFTVAIPTVRKRAQLKSVIDSVRRQTGIDHAEFEILIIDNSADGLANWVLEDYAAGTPHLRYVHERESGPAHARNRAVAEARGEILAFLDDDETADPGWLAALADVLEHSSADAAFGQVVACFEAVPERHVTLADRIYSRRFLVKPRADITRFHARLGTGNSAYHMRCFAGPLPFATDVSTGGGEDVVFLRELAQSGFRLAWAPSAIVLEHVARARLTPKALRSRRFRQGQLRSLVAARGSAGFLRVLLWIIVGTVQSATQVIAWLAAAIALHREARERAAIRLAGGLGKLLWWLDSPISYGAPEEPVETAQSIDKSYAFSRA